MNLINFAVQAYCRVRNAIFYHMHAVHLKKKFYFCQCYKYIKIQLKLLFPPRLLVRVLFILQKFILMILGEIDKMSIFEY
jgi:hypothetical protein